LDDPSLSPSIASVCRVAWLFSKSSKDNVVTAKFKLSLKGDDGVALENLFVEIRFCGEYLVTC